MIKKKKVLIALSGGIDSAVSAYLLIKKGYEVEAAFMKNWSSTAGVKQSDCPWLQDRQDALRVAAFLRIPLHTLDFEKQYAKTVMKYFFEEYKKGRTPNPDVMCNKEIKFKLLYNWAMKKGFDFLATGHYARIHTTPSANAATPPMQGGDAPRLFVISGKGRSLSSLSKEEYPAKRGEVVCHLERSADEFKDQTYFIYNIKTNQLPHILFPIGGMKKSAVRLLARKLELPNAEKRESMGLCFVGKIRLKDFLEQKLPPKPGEIILISNVSSRPTPVSGYHRAGGVEGSLHSSPYALLLGRDDRLGKAIGHHQGLFNYTIGQRQGLKIGGTGPYFVVKKDLKHNRLYVTNNPDDEALMMKEVEIHSVNWIGSPPGTGGVPREAGGGGRIENGDTTPSRFAGHPSYIRRGGSVVLLGRYRHQGELVPLSIAKIKKDIYRVVFKHPQKAVASGQSLVLYNGKQCLGGGIIV